MQFSHQMGRWALKPNPRLLGTQDGVSVSAGRGCRQLCAGRLPAPLPPPLSGQCVRQCWDIAATRPDCCLPSFPIWRLQRDVSFRPKSGLEKSTENQRMVQTRQEFQVRAPLHIEEKYSQSCSFSLQKAPRIKQSILVLSIPFPARPP